MNELEERKEYAATLRAKNLSALDDQKGFHSTRNDRNRNTKTFGFRHNSHAIGSTIRHFQTINDIPELSATVSRTKGSP